VTTPVSNQLLRSILREGGTKAMLWCLAQSFPSVANLLARVKFEAFSPLDLRTLAVSGVSHSERMALLFLLRVWNSHTDWDDLELMEEWREHLSEDPAVPLQLDPRLRYRVGKFDVFEALSVWDDDHRRVFRAWAEDPVWP
jgi:hypothetical protein